MGNGLALQMQSAVAMGANATNKKQREVYVGNLTVGMVTAQMLQELFNGALQPCTTDGLPPVTNVSMNMDGKFAFVELRTEPLSALAMNLDKVCDSLTSAQLYSAHTFVRAEHVF